MLCSHIGVDSLKAFIMNTVSFIYLFLVVEVSWTKGFHLDVAVSGTQKPTDRSVQFKSLLRHMYQKATDKATEKGITGTSITKQPDPTSKGKNMTADVARDTALFPDSRPLRMDPFDALPPEPLAPYTSSKPSDAPVPDSNPSNPSVFVADPSLSTAAFSFSSVGPSGSSMVPTGSRRGFYNVKSSGSGNNPSVSSVGPSVSTTGYSFSSLSSSVSNLDPSNSPVSSSVSMTSVSFPHSNSGTQSWLSQKVSTTPFKQYSVSPQTSYSFSLNRGTTSYQQALPHYKPNSYDQTVHQPIKTLASSPIPSPTMTSTIYSNTVHTRPALVQLVTKLVPTSFGSLYSTYSAQPHTGTTQTDYQATRLPQMYNIQKTSGDYNIMGCDKTCTKICVFGYETDSNGCRTCTCKRPVSVMCPVPVCSHVCPFGAERNAVGCDTCTCKSNPILGALQKYLQSRLMDFRTYFADNEI